MSERSPFYRVLEALPSDRRRRPPLERWQPDRRGRIDIRIDREGRWFHEGRPFERLELVRLFAGLLRREDDGYYLVTPDEMLRIEVADVPFVAIRVERRFDAGRPALVFDTNVGDRVTADARHPLWVETDSAGHPRPYVRVRERLDALIARQPFYELASQAERAPGADGETYVVRSSDATFVLGPVD